jgi:L-lactate dehydrogenase complex protein LldG
VINSDTNSNARDVILRSIRSHLAASVAHDAIYAETNEAGHTSHVGVAPKIPMDANANLSQNAGAWLVGLFSESLEAVDGHCVIVQGELEIVHALTSIIGELQKTKLRAKRIALSDDAVVERLTRLIAVEVDEIAVAPGAAALFGYDVGISRVQAAIAETGTLVLDAEHERHRLVSLVPAVHIAIVEATQIYQTLGETLAVLRRGTEEVSPTITFITGPSRTADIELTLAIGVHGPQELYVIVDEGAPLQEV